MIVYKMDMRGSCGYASVCCAHVDTFSLVGIPVLCAILTDAKTLETELAQQAFAIILCTLAYSKKVEAR